MIDLNIIYTETYSLESFGIKDISTYLVGPIYNPKITICVPGFGEKEIDFIPNQLNVFDSTVLGITELGCEQELPDGIYTLKYCTTLNALPISLKTCTQLSFFRVHKLQEKFDNAFLSLEISECDGFLKKQELLNLSIINAFIQTTIASANNCSEKQALTLYKKANSMLDRFENSDCGCH